MGEPEDADPAPITRIHPARGVVESTISPPPKRRGARRCAGPHGEISSV